MVHETYSFVCLRCGHGWEQAYEIRHATDQSGREYADYFVGGLRVPSPLTRAACPSCGGRQVRILRPGRVDSARPRFD